VTGLAAATLTPLAPILGMDKRTIYHTYRPCKLDILESSQEPKQMNHMLACQPTSAKINISYSILFNLTTSYSSYFRGKKGISRNKTSFFLLMQILIGYEPTLIPSETLPSNNETIEEQIRNLMENHAQATNAINQSAKGNRTIERQYNIGDIRKNQLFLLHLIRSYSSYFGGKKGISENKTSFFLLMDLIWLKGKHLTFPHQATKLNPKRYGPFKIIKAISLVVVY